jgi:hypothetical protein
MVEGNQNLKRYQERLKDNAEQIGILSAQISSSTEEEKLKKIQTLLNKQLTMNNEIRELKKKEINFKLTTILSHQNKLKMQLFASFIPEQISDIAKLEAFQHIYNLEETKRKAFIAIDQILNHYFIVQKTEDDFNLNMLSYLAQLLFKIMELYLISTCLEHNLCHFQLEQYEQNSKDSRWNSLLASGSFLDQIIRQIKEETISPHNSIDAFKNSVNNLWEFQLNIASSHLLNEYTEKTNCLKGKEIQISY